LGPWCVSLSSLRWTGNPLPQDEISSMIKHEHIVKNANHSCEIESLKTLQELGRSLCVWHCQD
jgi:hypothetical protein